MHIKSCRKQLLPKIAKSELYKSYKQLHLLQTKAQTAKLISVLAAFITLKLNCSCRFFHPTILLQAMKSLKAYCRTHRHQAFNASESSSCLIMVYFTHLYSIWVFTQHMVQSTVQPFELGWSELSGFFWPVLLVDSVFFKTCTCMGTNCSKLMGKIVMAGQNWQRRDKVLHNNLGICNIPIHTCIQENMVPLGISKMPMLGSIHLILKQWCNSDIVQNNYF